MVPRIVAIAALCLLATFSFAQQKAEIRLPADPSAIVLTFDRRGGDIGSVPARVNSDPILTIRADGSVTFVDRYEPDLVLQSKISLDELQDILRLADDQDFFSFDATAVKAAIATEARRTGGFGVGGASDTVIHIRLADREHDAVFNGLSAFTQQYPGIKPLAQLFTVEKRLIVLTDQLRVKALAH
jgi:hypothetical protein